MSNELIERNFIFNGSGVRVETIEGEPWFVAKDVSDILGYRDAANMVRNLQDDEKGTHTVRTLGGDQKATIINESGLYNAIFRSKRAEAQAFRKWVTSEVLPSIRKDGGYIGGRTIEEIERNAERAIERRKTKIGFASMTNAIQKTRELAGKETSAVHYISEAEMINRIVIGQTAKEFKEDNGLKPKAAIRDYFPEAALEAVTALEDMNKCLILAKLPFKERKRAISEYYKESLQMKVVNGFMAMEDIRIPEIKGNHQ